MTKNPKPYLQNILNSIDAINRYRPDSMTALANDPKSYDAILMRLQDIGENLTRVRESFPDYWDSNADNSWNQAIGLRNIISTDTLK